MKRIFFVATIALSLAPMLGAQADTSYTPEQIVATRQAGFLLMYGVTAGIKTTLDANGDFSKMGAEAQGIKDFMAVVPSLFPVGTETAHKTTAKPEVWSNPAGFKAAADVLIQAASKFGDAVKSGDKAAVTDAADAMNKACGACHKDFRQRNS